jgi:hypothetical protein
MHRSKISSFDHLVGARRQRLSTKRLTRDEAFLLAVNIAKLQSVPRQILKTSRDAKFSRLGRLSGPAVSACR